ncbi:MAG TPA: FAD-dependent oxidoreductase [Nitrospinota bacterium]|nr:FAD-dependent oxidoreductase [Nitrospinota bacterium]
MRYLIIGNSAAGISAAKSIRKADRNGIITIVSDEGEYGYSRIAIPEIIKGKFSKEKVTLCHEDFYTSLDIRLRINSKVKSIDPEKNTVVLDDNRKLTYDKLLIASGASPLFPDIKGIDKDGIYGVRNLKDLEKIKSGLSQGKRVTILGGGLVGLKTAEALVKPGYKITIIELLDRILPLRLDHICSEMLTEEVTSQGIRIILNSTIQEILGRERVESVIVNEERIPTDILIMAIGVKPNCDFLADSKIEIQDGIMVNDYLQTNIENIYAAGDVAVVKDIISGEHQNIPIWPEASIQGRIAGLNMAGIRQEYSGGMAMNSIKVFNLPIISFGYIQEDREMGYDEVVRYLPKDRWYRRMIFREDRLRGAIFVGEIKPAGIAQWLIRKDIEIPEEKRRLLMEKGFDFAKISSGLHIKIREIYSENRSREMY